MKCEQCKQKMDEELTCLTMTFTLKEWEAIASALNCLEMNRYAHVEVRRPLLPTINKVRAEILQYLPGDNKIW